MQSGECCPLRTETPLAVGVEMEQVNDSQWIYSGEEEKVYGPD